jgi:hypothetical protein
MTHCGLMQSCTSLIYYTTIIVSLTCGKRTHILITQIRTAYCIRHTKIDEYEYSTTYDDARSTALGATHQATTL